MNFYRRQVDRMISELNTTDNEEFFYTLDKLDEEVYFKNIAAKKHNK